MARPPITRARPYTPRSGAFAGRTFHSERQYRNALARRKGFSSWHHQQRSRAPATSLRSIKALRPSEQAARARSLEALSLMRRDGLSLKAAAKRAGTTPNTVLRHAGPALHRERGRVRANPADRMVRTMSMLGPQGAVSVSVRSSRQASLIAGHWAAVQRYVSTGDESELRRYDGVSVAGIDFETDPDVIDELAAIGELDFEDIYELVA